ncbi:MAG: hypothetical protein QOJ15_5021 [Bradyrhizobium sp.]|jgi:hypothetical protein|nr:hypothetical protein [Bradyrhizobium sp.]
MLREWWDGKHSPPENAGHSGLVFLNHYHRHSAAPNLGPLRPPLWRDSQEALG